MKRTSTVLIGIILFVTVMLAGHAAAQIPPLLCEDQGGFFCEDGVTCCLPPAPCGPGGCPPGPPCCLVPDVLDADLDIKPGSDANPINPFSQGVIPVAILGSDTFDVLDVDVTTLAFGPGGGPLAHRNGLHSEDDADEPYDFNGDDFDDVLAHFRTEESGIAFGMTEACVTGELLDSTPFEGCDAIFTVGCGLGFEIVFLLPPLVWLRQRRRRIGRV